MADSYGYLINGNFPSCRQYTLTYGDFVSLQRNIINGNVSISSVTNFFTQISDYFIDGMYFPIDITQLLYVMTAANTITIGKTTIAITETVQEITMQKTCIKWFTTTITRRFNNFLDFAPFTRFTLLVPFFESFSLNPMEVYGHTVDGYFALDTHSGQATCYLFLDDSILLASRSCQLGIKIPLGKTNEEEQQRNNILQSISLGGSLLGLGIGVASGNPLITAGSVSMLTGNVTKYLTNNVDRLTGYKGGSGGRDNLGIEKSIKLIEEYPQNITQPDASIRGRMLNENKLLSSISGFTQIGDIQFNPSGYDIYQDEINEIIDLLKTGVIL